MAVRTGNVRLVRFEDRGWTGRSRRDSRGDLADGGDQFIRTNLHIRPHLGRSWFLRA